MQDVRPESRLLLPLEAPVALLVAFLGSMALGFLAFFFTALVVEERGVGALVSTSHKLSVPLVAAEAEEPPSTDRTAELVREKLPGADVLVLPDGEASWNLTAWFDHEAPDDAMGRLVYELQNLGWEHPDTTLVVQPSLMAAMENPTRMRLYVPALMTVQAVCFIGVAILMLLWRKPAVLPGRSPLGAALLWGAGAALAAFMTSSVIGYVLHLLGFEIEEQSWIRALMADGSTVLALSPWLVLIGPLSEEVFFRGYVFRRLHAAAGPGWGYAASAILFGLIHVHPVGIPMYVTIGLVFCWVHRRTGTLLAPVVAHVVYNGMVLAIPFLVSP